jgi:fructose-1,6-bisphosphatase I
VIYGSSTMLVYTTGQGVAGFTLDPSIGEFLLSHPRIVIPRVGKYYSVNESNFARWNKGIQTAVRGFHGDRPQEMKGKNSRYIGSLVADFHRNLIAGGVFLYPADTKNTRGKLRLLYECSPMAFIAEQAEGSATDGVNRILDIVPSALHQRTPLVIGSREDVGYVADTLRKVGE